MKNKEYKKWGIETHSTSFGTEDPFVKPFGICKRKDIVNSHRKTSSPLTSPPVVEGSPAQMKGGSKK